MHRHRHEHYTITRNGRAVAAVLPIDDLEALEEPIFWLEQALARLRADTASAGGQAPPEARWPQPRIGGTGRTAPGDRAGPAASVTGRPTD
jgi:hypothetical protein